MEKKLIFGIGTGRCGTVSLCELLNNQKFTHFTHEKRPLLSWNGPKAILDERIGKILLQEGRYVGEIAFFYLPYVEYILNNYPDAKIICLKRAASKVVKSYMEKTRRRNHWMKHSGLIWKRCEWDKCYPKYKSLTKRNALRKYWKEYYETVDHLKSAHPESILLMDMHEALNTKTGIRQLLNFVGIEKEHLVVKKHIRKNTKKERYLISNLVSSLVYH